MTLALGWNVTAASSSDPHHLPNIVFILTDNHGAWTLGCYGNPDIRTPNIDRLAAEGMKFTHALSSNPVCSPTRATYLTGLIPSQHGMHCFFDRKYMMGPEAYNALEEFRSLPEVLKDAGYICGLAGKWHLGDNLHPHEGFSYWVTMPTGSTSTFYNEEVIEGGKVHRELGSLTDYWTKHAIEFIEQNKEHPFFLYLAYNGPYALGPHLLQPARNRHAAYYADKPMLSFPREVPHPWLKDNKEYLNNIQAIRRVAAEISGVDDGVGEVMAAIKRLGLDDNTLVVFAGDQGWMGGQNGIWGMGDQTSPVGAFELMMQVPLIYRQPGRIPAGSTSDIIVSNYDFMPTVLGYVGRGPMPDQPVSPGRDYSAYLKGEHPPWDNVMYYEFEYTRAIRAKRWKYVARTPDGPGELYDMQRDPFERMNLFGQPQLAAVQAEMAGRLDAFFARYADPKYDLWHGGRSKARIFTPR